MRYNIEFSCAAASTQHPMEFKTALTDPCGLLGDNCNDLLGMHSYLLNGSVDDILNLFHEDFSFDDTSLVAGTCVFHHCVYKR